MGGTLDEIESRVKGNVREERRKWKSWGFRSTSPDTPTISQPSEQPRTISSTVPGPVPEPIVPPVKYRAVEDRSLRDHRVMDALELQAALVKLDPATTVTPIGSNVKMVPAHHRIAFAVDLDDTLTLETAVQNDEKSSNSGVSSTLQSGSNTARKLQPKCTASLTVPGHQNHQTNNAQQQQQQQISVSKCNLAEVR